MEPEMSRESSKTAPTSENWLTVEARESSNTPPLKWIPKSITVSMSAVVSTKTHWTISDWTKAEGYRTHSASRTQERKMLPLLDRMPSHQSLTSTPARDNWALSLDIFHSWVTVVEVFTGTRMRVLVETRSLSTVKLTPRTSTATTLLPALTRRAPLRTTSRTPAI